VQTALLAGVRDKKREEVKAPTAAGPTNNQKERDASGHGWKITIIIGP
jgi:hypothetical protein